MVFPTRALVALSVSAVLTARAAPLAAERTLVLSKKQLASSEPAHTFSFSARGDERLTRARVSVVIDGTAAPSVRAVELEVNGERAGRFEAGLSPGAHGVEIGPALLRPHNALTVRLHTQPQGGCGEVPPGAWRVVKSLGLSTEGERITLPDELALLPLPFVDPGVDRRATVPVVLGSEPTADRARLALVVASWLGLHGVPLRFQLYARELPASNAVVLLDAADEAAALGIEAASGPAIRMADHPQGHGKLLVVSGNAPGELEAAVRALANGTVTLAGPMVLPDASAGSPPSPSVGRSWLPLGGAVAIAEGDVAQSLSHAGTGSGTIAVRFRLPPDTWLWPTESVPLDLVYAVAGRGVTPPRLDVELNGSFLATLPEIEPQAKERIQRARLRVHREQLRGSNELVLHVSYPLEAGACRRGTERQARVRLLPETAIHLDDAVRFVRLPDLRSFVDDGFPYSLHPDLAGTAVVLPPRPSLAELATAMSFVAHVASVTGRAGTDVTVMTADRLQSEPALDKDLLIVAAEDRMAALEAWAHRLPLAFGPGGPRAQTVASSGLLSWMDAARVRAEVQRAERALAGLEAYSAAIGFESPLSPLRAAVLITASSSRALPSVDELRSAVEEAAGPADVLVASGGRSWAFRLGPRFGRGELGRWTALRWALAERWWSLLPALLFGAVLLGGPVHLGLSRRVRARLNAGNGERR